MAERGRVSAQEAATQLDVSVTTLRRWSKEYAQYLSEDGSKVSDKSGPRTYTENDVSTLARIKELTAQGLSADQVSRHLQTQAMGLSTDDRVAVVRAGEEEASRSPALLLMRDILQSLSEGQEAILNSQQANRSLLGVVIQDNFNLKEENAKLRERMLKLEQELAELRRHNWDHRSLLEARVRRLEHKGWLARLLGL